MFNPIIGPIPLPNPNFYISLILLKRLYDVLNKE